MNEIKFHGRGGSLPGVWPRHRHAHGSSAPRASGRGSGRALLRGSGLRSFSQYSLRGSHVSLALDIAAPAAAGISAALKIQGKEDIRVLAFAAGQMLEIQLETEQGRTKAMKDALVLPSFTAPFPRLVPTCRLSLSIVP